MCKEGSMIEDIKQGFYDFVKGTSKAFWEGARETLDDLLEEITKIMEERY